MKRLRWELQQALRSVGLPGWVAMALVLACAVGWWAGVAPLIDGAREFDTDSIAL